MLGVMLSKIFSDSQHWVFLLMWPDAKSCCQTHGLPKATSSRYLMQAPVLSLRPRRKWNGGRDTPIFLAMDLCLYELLKVWWHLMNWVVGSFGFYGISTIVGYLMPNHFYSFILNIYDLVCLGFMAYQLLYVI